MLGTTIAACPGHDRISQRDDYRIADKRDVPSQPIPQATRSSEFIWDRSLSRDTLQAPTTDVLSRRFSGLLVLERHGATFPRVTETGTRSFSAFVDGPRAACSRRSSTPYRLMPTSST